MIIIKNIKIYGKQLNPPFGLVFVFGCPAPGHRRVDKTALSEARACASDDDDDDKVPHLLLGQSLFGLHLQQLQPSLRLIPWQTTPGPLLLAEGNNIVRSLSLPIPVPTLTATVPMNHPRTVPTTIIHTVTMARLVQPHPLPPSTGLFLSNSPRPVNLAP